MEKVDMRGYGQKKQKWGDMEGRNAEGRSILCGLNGGPILGVRWIPKAEQPGLRSPPVPNKGPVTLEGRRTRLTPPPGRPYRGQGTSRSPSRGSSWPDPDAIPIPVPAGEQRSRRSRRRRLRERRARACAPRPAPSPDHCARSANGAAPQRQRCQ